jgi:hypothetical protein
MKTVTVKADEFFELHESIKGRGCHIIMCVDIANRNGRFYQLTWIEKA